MLKPIINHYKKIPIGLLFFTLILVIIEIYEYLQLKETGFLRGDFSTPVYDSNVATPAFLLSIFSWVGTYLVTRWTQVRHAPRIAIPQSNWVLLIFAVNYFITVVGDVGNVLSATKSGLSIITTLIPVNLLILALAVQQTSWRFFVCAILLVLIDLQRLLLGATFQMVYLFIAKASRLWLLVALVCLPLLIIIGTELVKFKYEARNMEINDVETLLINSVTSRISSTNTFVYGLGSLDDLSKFCHTQDYSSQYFAAVLSVVPKKIFGLEWVKTYNNCLIEYRLSRDVADSSVNSPWLLNLMMLWQYDVLKCILYLFFTVSFLFLFVVASNYFFGNSAAIIKYWLLFMFVWTGNILLLTIPTYAFLILYIFYRMHGKSLRPKPDNIRKYVFKL